MAKTRMLKHNLRTSLKVASWPIEIRYFWVLLWGYVDDHGKAIDSPLLVKADCFPLDPDITGDTVDGWLWRLTDDAVVARYTVAGTDYLQIVNWKEHQKPPHPTDDVLPSFSDPQAVIRELHASRMNGAGKSAEDFTPVLGWVESGSGIGSVNESSPSVTDAFDHAWTHWPKKVERKAALEQFKRAYAKTYTGTLKGLTDWVVRFGDAYAATTEKKFVPALGVWLSHERWTDELPTASTPRDNRITPEQRARQTLALASNMRELE